MIISYRLKKLANIYLDGYPYRRYMTKNRCIFVHVPKAAGTSILQALAGHNRYIQRDHCTILDFKRASPGLFEQYYSFTFVRDPLDRVQSIYRYLRGGGNQSSNLIQQQELNENFADFDEFVDGYLNEQRLHVQKLFKPQFSFICDVDFTPLVDFIGRYEKIQQDFNQVCQTLGLKVELPQANISQTGKQTADPNSIEKIKQLYRRDYELFYMDQL